jgi:predicted RNA-binding protein with PUA-like domain
MHYFLMKTEPSSYSIEDLKRDKVTAWEGVRNYQARNTMRDDMHVGDLVFFYHSNVAEPGIVGEGRVVTEVHADQTAFDPTSHYYDPKSTHENPRWYCVGIEFVRTYPRTITLCELRGDPKLVGLLVTRRGNRLSVLPVDEVHATHIQTLV